MKYVFEDLNYRRYEWKCDSLNRPSANAAIRLGFTYEGRFRNHAIYKGRSRDTDWFSIIAVSGQHLRNDLRIGCLLRILMNRDNRNVL